jgi:hypothetical protein
LLLLLPGCGGDGGGGGITPPATGSIEIRITTAGDAAGYTVSVDGAAAETVGPNATITKANLEAGSHTVQLGGLPAGCTVAGQNPQSVSVLAGQTVVVSFAVTCAPPSGQSGALSITTATTGEDPDGYLVSVDGGTPQPIVANGTIALQGIAAGSHTIELSGLASNCVVSGTNPVSATVIAGQTTTVTFTIVCSAGTGSIHVSTTTTGTSLDPNGYTLWLDGVLDGAMGLDDERIFSQLTPGNHQVELRGVAPNCSVAGPNPVTATVIPGGTVPVPFAITCTTQNTPPQPSMDIPECDGLSCSFRSTSTDDGAIASTQWNFGDPNSGASNTTSGIDVEHDFSSAGTYTVTLTVTDNQGLTGTTTQSVTVTEPAGGESCTGTSATEVTCTITLSQRSTITITLESEDCEIGNNNVLIPPPEPRAQVVFFNVCHQPTPQDYTLVDNTGVTLILEAGTQLPIVFRRGSDPVAVQPQAQITSTGANTWSIAVDDGGNPGGPGEPDFTDVALTVTAVPQP